MARMGWLAGYEPLPWQCQVADVTGEVLPSGRFAYPLVVLVVPRRAGKTLLVLLTLLHRCQLSNRLRAWYTCQRREDAAKQFRDSWVPALEGSPLAPKLHFRRSQGSEGFTFTSTGSKTQLFAPNQTALHGVDADMVVIDEAWAFPIDQGEQLEAGVRPAQATRPLRQTWIVSAGGNENSSWLNDWMLRGRKAAEVDPGHGVAYFEWSADRDAPGYDPYDETLWWATHPALGHQLDIEALRADALTMSRELFELSYLCAWDLPSETGAVKGLDAESWENLGAEHWTPGPPLAFGVDMTPDRDRAAVSVAGVDRDRTVTEVIEATDGTAWLGDALGELHAQFPAAPLAGDTLLAGGLLDRAERAGWSVVRAGAQELSRACAGFVDLATAGRLAHREQKALTDALGLAVRRPLGDGWAWSRSRSAGDISPLLASVLAAHALEVAPQTPGPLIAAAS